MPICTTCTTFMPYLYTIYQSAYNTRLEQCPECHTFADPYVEHDTLTLLIDLILLKRGVYRHLLYNRGAKPRRAVESGKGQVEEEPKVDDWERESARWILVLRLGMTLVFVDAFIRWSYLNSDHPPQVRVSPWSLVTIEMFAKTFIGCLAETAAFHGGVMLSYFLLQRTSEVLGTYLSAGRNVGKEEKEIPAIRKEFRFSLIPLALFYSSLTKLFLLFLLTIWRPSKLPSTPSPSTNTTLWPMSESAQQVLSVLEDDKLDREWIVRNVLGGMSAGFGLRVILDSHAIFVTMTIVVGWATKTAIAGFIGNWIGGNRIAEIWMAYSIP